MGEKDWRRRKGHGKGAVEPKKTISANRALLGEQSAQSDEKRGEQTAENVLCLGESDGWLEEEEEIGLANFAPEKEPDYRLEISRPGFQK